MNKQKESKKTESSNELYTVLGVVYLSEIAPYNEYDHAMNGGYYNCPHCGEQQYTNKAEVGEKEECACGGHYIYE